ncbi:MAG TPA: hypothetical protein VJC16_03790 [Candidatus Nanoarchaeia archaeon]|nr:hypothetical protein [Candidatus Nanoarchaeia archaeon]
MIYMFGFWALYVILLAYIIYTHFKKSKMNQNIAISILIVSSSFLVIGLVTGDPVFSTLGIPREYEWLVGLILSGFTAWQVYFNPLKERLIRLEKNFSEYFGVSKTKFEHIEQGIEEIKRKIKR